MGMYYRRLIIREFQLFWSASASGFRIVSLSGIAIAMVVALNQPIGKVLQVGWQGLPPWWAIFLILVFLGYGLLRANYAEIQCRDARITEKDAEINLARSLVTQYETAALEIVFPDDPTAYNSYHETTPSV